METLAEELLQRPLKPLERALLEVVWSEHCSYRQSRDRLRLFPTQGPQVRVGPGEGAGAVAWEGPLSLAFRLESHNHPSASAPWEGAATGAGGILRDLVSIGARPLFLGAALSLPPFPSPLEEGIREGLSHYARQLNLPVPLLTVQRSKAFAEKPLVNVLAVGVRHEEKALSARGAYPGARLLLVGKEVDGLGLGAAAAASRAGEPFAASVPSSDPLLGQQVLRLTLDLGERGLLLALQDLGAGGLGGAAWELALKNGCGVSLDLEKVPAVPQARDPFSLLLAETQERMLYAVAPEIREDVLDLARQAGLPAADVGAFTSDPIFLALWEGEALAALALPPLREGPPPRLWPACEETIALSRRERTFFFSPHPFTIGETGGAALLVQGEHHLKREPLGETFFLLVTAALSLALGGFAPWGISNSLNLGDMEEGSTQRAFLSVTEGIARGGRLLGLPVVSGNVSLQNKGRRSLPPVPVLALVGKRPPQEGGRSKAGGHLGFQYGEGIVAWTRDPMTSFVPLLEELIDLTQSGLWRFDPQRIQVLQDGGSFYLRFRAARQQAAPLPVTFAWQPLGGEETPWAF